MNGKMKEGINGEIAEERDEGRKRFEEGKEKNTDLEREEGITE